MWNGTVPYSLGPLYIGWGQVLCTTANIKFFQYRKCVGSPVELQQNTQADELLSIINNLYDIQSCLSENPCQQGARASFGCFSALPICHLGFPWLRKEATVSLPTGPSSPPPKKPGHHRLDRDTVWLKFLTVSNNRTVDLFEEPLWLKLCWSQLPGAMSVNWGSVACQRKSGEIIRFC